MANELKNSTCVVFHRGFRGYKKREVEEYISRITQEHAIADDNYRERIALLVRESEQAAQLLRTLQDDKTRLLSDCDEYKKQLKEQSETISTLYERLDLLGSETERLQNTLAEIKKGIDQTAPSAEEWKERALAAEETVRRLAEAELKENKEKDGSQHFRVPIGKKAYLDLTLRKDDKSV
jgi:chromosome segregation ATPase